MEISIENNRIVVNSLMPMNESLDYDGWIIAVLKPISLLEIDEEQQYKTIKCGRISKQGKDRFPEKDLVDDSGYFYSLKEFIGWMPFPVFILRVSR